MDIESYGADHKSWNYRTYAIGCAYDLCYPKSVIERLKAADTDTEISRIMCDARNGIY